LQPDGSGRLFVVSCRPGHIPATGHVRLCRPAYAPDDAWPAAIHFSDLHVLPRHIHVWGNLEPGCAGDVHFYLAGLAAVYGGKLAADAAFAALRERKKAGRHPSLFCTVERMGIWTEMVRLSWASCRKNSQYGNFHAYVYL
jgi:hypothetical protein